MSEQIAKTNTRSGGPYSKAQRDARRTKVYRLHFELGHPITKIAGMLNVNYNTILSDVNFFYKKLNIELNFTDLSSWLLKQIQRLEIQRTRMFEELHKANVLSDRLAIEKILCDIDAKILQIVTKVYSSEIHGYERCMKDVNRYYDQHKRDEGFVMPYQFNLTGSKAQQKIWKIIKEDRENKRVRVHQEGTPLIRG